MNIDVTATKVTITSENLTMNKGEYHINDCAFTFSAEYNDLIKRAVFTTSTAKNYVVEIENNTCVIPEQVLRFSDKCKIGVYAYANNEDELLLRYSPEPTYFKLEKGSYVSDAEHFTPATPVQDLIDQYNQNAIQKTNEFNTNVISKTEDFDEHVADKIEDFDEHTVSKITEFDNNAIRKTNDFNANAISKTEQFNENAEEKTDTLNQIAEGIEDMTTAIQFATFEVDNDMGLYIVQADRLINTNFIFNQETGGLEVMIV